MADGIAPGGQTQDDLLRIGRIALQSHECDHHDEIGGAERQQDDEGAE
jgi:hypothetical protein